MICGNCKRDIQNKLHCPHCGFNPALDTPDSAGNSEKPIPKLPPIKTKLLKTINSPARAALGFAIFGFMPPFGLLSFIFAIVGFSNAKYRRNGRKRSIAALILLALWAAYYAFVILMSYASAYMQT